MGPSQGKHSNMNALRILAGFAAPSLESLGTTTAHRMFTRAALPPGRTGFTPERRTPWTGSTKRSEPCGCPRANWRRPEYYAVPGKTRAQAIAAEVGAVRTEWG